MVDPDEFEISFGTAFENFGRLSAASLSRFLNDLQIDLRRISVTSRSFAEWTAARAWPMALAELRLTSDGERAFVEFGHQAVTHMLDRMLGGPGPAAETTRFTTLDLALLETLVVIEMTCLRQTWSEIMELSPRLGALHTGPDSLKTSSPGAGAVVSINYSMRFPGGVDTFALHLEESVFEQAVPPPDGGTRLEGRAAEALRFAERDPDEWARRPLDFLQAREAADLARMLAAESSQMVALVLSALRLGTGKAVLAHFKPERAREVERRMALTEVPANGVLGEIARVLQRGG